MNKNILLYILLLAIFLPGIILFIPVGLAVVLLLIPLGTYFFSLYAIEKFLRALTEENVDKTASQKIIRVFKQLPSIYRYILLITLIVSMAIIVYWDGLVMALLYLAFIMLSAFGRKLIQ
ncbi:hypothetical protein RH915_10950 [Serpentinicella sp. ANB-PHB4]|uniref:hypothetical protein n=1 Tax=Serpentinicella sp. ANB-PHB4 TaxID=3074076 RepID=UPI0028555E09|nr:hypothetical protein [Serpentinicella sp. ANB-PHB4]MDR5660007.1 hypothetical protein [Serpentinicella sp. ANB-PHB4]